MRAIAPKPESLANLVLLVRAEKVLLDADLADLYGVEVRALNQAVSRNRVRFPGDFMFQLTSDEWMDLRSKAVPAPGGTTANSSQIVMSSRKHRGISYRPYAFTEQGVAMLSSVLPCHHVSPGPPWSTHTASKPWRTTNMTGPCAAT